jgi:hypothetical protein
MCLTKARLMTGLVVLSLMTSTTIGTALARGGRGSGGYGRSSMPRGYSTYPTNTSRSFSTYSYSNSNLHPANPSIRPANASTVGYTAASSSEPEQITRVYPVSIWAVVPQTAAYKPAAAGFPVHTRGSIIRENPIPAAATGGVGASRVARTNPYSSSYYTIPSVRPQRPGDPIPVRSPGTILPGKFQLPASKSTGSAPQTSSSTPSTTPPQSPPSKCGGKGCDRNRRSLDFGAYGWDSFGGGPTNASTATEQFAPDESQDPVNAEPSASVAPDAGQVQVGQSLIRNRDGRRIACRTR